MSFVSAMGCVISHLKLCRAHTLYRSAAQARLAAQLNITGLQRWRIVFLPRLRGVLGFSAGLTAALSMGDLGVIALFADPTAPTLPLYLYQLMGSYQNNAAEGAALILLALSLTIFWLFDKGGRSRAADQ